MALPRRGIPSPSPRYRPETFALEVTSLHPNLWLHRIGPTIASLHHSLIFSKAHHQSIP